MSSMVLCKNFIFNNPKLRRSSFYLHRNSSTLVSQLGDTRRRFAAGFIPNAGKRKRERSWWQRFFFDEDGNWLGLKEDDMLVEAEDDLEMDGSDEGEKFEAWKTRAEAIVELREAQQDMTNEENRKWEDWLADSNSTSWEAVQSDPTQEKGLLYSLTDFVLRKEDDDDDDMLYEDRVFRYASLNSDAYGRELIIFSQGIWYSFISKDSKPNIINADPRFSVLFNGSAKCHSSKETIDNFVGRYVKTVPLAAEMLDVRRNQKLQMVEELKIERARFHFEMEIGKSPPLSDEEVWWELRHKALLKTFKFCKKLEWRFKQLSTLSNAMHEYEDSGTIYLQRNSTSSLSGIDNKVQGRGDALNMEEVYRT
ncbi:unnamed protein product [Prunus armeniaca]|uniref:Uncharacterized protein n=1 Tax=Prunus armeniaca TaxID=36596 RepID=A0A6J5VXE0_PRUAR|nr:unnamed protein product [Prunus armeniaca]